MLRSCEQAMAAGLPGVAFTDHLDFTTWTDGDPIGMAGLNPHRYAWMHPLDVSGYLAALEDCRERYPDLRILSGVEIGEAHLWAASAAAAVAGSGVDRILGSLHAVPSGGRLRAADDLFRQMPTDDVMRVYFAELLRLIEGSGLFQVLAHLDFPRRMWPLSAGPYEERAFEAEYRAVLRALAVGDRVLEVNTKSPLASVDLVRWWREAGGRAVSFGSDAHQPWRVGDKFKLAVDVVEAAGFRAGRDRFDFWRLLRSVTTGGGVGGGTGGGVGGGGRRNGGRVGGGGWRNRRRTGCPSAGGRLRAAAGSFYVQVSPKRAIMSSQLSPSVPPRPAALSSWALCAEAPCAGVPSSSTGVRGAGIDRLWQCTAKRSSA